MKLSEPEIKTLIETSKLSIQNAYKGKMDDDEYFNRGFLLACREFSNQMITVLNSYEIRTKE